MGGRHDEFRIVFRDIVIPGVPARRVNQEQPHGRLIFIAAVALGKNQPGFRQGEPQAVLAGVIAMFVNFIPFREVIQHFQDNCLLVIRFTLHQSQFRLIAIGNFQLQFGLTLNGTDGEQGLRNGVAQQLPQ